MRCPSCEADQPDGVTICGFCGSAMVRPPAASGPTGAAAFGGSAAAARSTSGGLLVAGLAFILVGAGVVAWREVRRSGAPEVETPPPAEAPAEPAVAAVAAVAAAPPDPSDRAGEPSERRLDEGDLWRFADDLERLTSVGDARELGRRLDARLRYRSEVVDLGEVRRFDGGMAELLAHWMTPLWIDRIEGVDGGDSPATVAVEVGADGRTGTIERSADSMIEPSRVAFPVHLLMRLARGIPVTGESLSDLDLRRVTRAASRCHVDELLRVALTDRGLRVVGATRSGRCGV